MKASLRGAEHEILVKTSIVLMWLDVNHIVSTVDEKWKSCVFDKYQLWNALNSIENEFGQKVI